MKIIILSVVAIIIAFGAVFLFTNTSKAPSTTSEVNEGQTQSSESVTQEDATTLEAETDIRVDVTETQEQSADPVASKPEPVVQAEAEAEVKKPAPAPAVAQSKEFTIDAFSFGFSEFELQVNVGDTVTINLTNSDGYHDWVLDEFGASTKQIQSGETTTVTFVATKKGSFEYYCSVGEHRAYGMVGTLVVR